MLDFELLLLLTGEQVHLNCALECSRVQSDVRNGST